MFEMSVFQGELIRNGSRKPTNIEINDTGITIGVIKKSIYLWSSISEITIDGPDSRQSRVTATRLATVGVFAFAAKKNTSETLVIISLCSGEVITVIFNKKAEPEVKAIFAPHLKKIATLDDSAGKDNQIGLPTEVLQSPRSKAEQIKEIGELLDRGLIDKNEFQELKIEILKTNPSETEQLELSKQFEHERSEIPVPSTPRIRDGEVDENGLEYIVRRPSDNVLVSVINLETSNIEALIELMMSAERTPPDRKIEKKWRNGFYKSFSENIGAPVYFSLEMHNAKRVIAGFEECGCEVTIEGTRKLAKGEYRFIELSEDEDPFEGAPPDALVGIGISSWNGQNENQLIDILWGHSLRTPATVDLFAVLIPHDISFWFLRYGTSIEIEPKLNALGCRIKRIQILDPEMEKIILGGSE
jgi:hypothetical protein